MSELAARLSGGTRRQFRVSLADVAGRLAPLVLCLAFTLTLALSLAASPRRGGDAHQYIAMAIQLSQFRPPSLSPAEEIRYRAWLESHPPESGFPDGALAVRQPALVREGRQEFSHFWVYPLLAAPATAIAGALGVHPLAAFTVTNAILLGGALWSAARVFGPIAALCVLASPLLWFIARAQVEVFTVALLCLAMAAAARGRWGWASVALAAASTQNAPIAATIPLFSAGGVAEWAIGRRSMNLPLVPNRFETRRAIVFATVVLGIALLHPAYYLVRLGVLTPQELNGGIAAELPTPGRFLAPLIDPEIGFVPWLPATAILALAGLILLARSARTALTEDRRLALSAACAVVVGVWFLAVFAQTTNVNSGGTVHVSRYALWLLPLTLPAIATVTRYVDARMPGLLLAGALGLFLVYLAYFWPAQPERYVEHSPQAAWLLTHFPDTYRSIPEVFVERTLHIDGGVRASAADPSCRLILIVAERPEHPCPLTSFEQARLAVWWQDGDAAVWVRRGAGGESSLTTALAAS